MSKALRFIILFGLVVMVTLAGCGKKGGGGESDSESEGGAGGGSIASASYVVFAWNDLGMHCLNPTYDEAVILPPYNNILAQVVRVGAVPTVVTSGVTVSYRIINNTYSYNKTDSYGAIFAQFWDNALALFGVDLAHDTGLNFTDPGTNNGLAGTMLVKDNHFEVNGVPVVPVDDSNKWNPYQVAEITVKDSHGNVLAKTQATVPTSDEINCAKCHDAPTPFGNVLLAHDKLHDTTLFDQKPVRCSDGSCHFSPILGQDAPGDPTQYLSYALHNSHSTRSAACYDCHPGDTTKCNRSTNHYGYSSDGGCTNCHGSMATMASLIAAGTKIPWQNEPTCASCHTGVAQVDTGSTLYKNAKGHGNMFCPSCHGSPHAVVPSRVGSDNYQALQYQGQALSIGACNVCHSSTRGGGGEDFDDAHGGSSPKHRNACHICHTTISQSTSWYWPHSFSWK